MSTLKDPHLNRLLAALPHEEYKRFTPQLEPVYLAKGRVIYKADDIVSHAYFPLDGMFSLLSTTKDGSTLEVAIVGNEGMVGIPSIWTVDKIPYQVTVQNSAFAMRVNKGSLDREFSRMEGLHDLLLRYTHALLMEVTQWVVCAHFHTVEQRLCCLLLIGRNRVKSDTLYLTQELLAHRLGVTRTRVTMTAANLQREKLIRYCRGTITILNRQGLEETACECYRVVTEDIDQFIAA